MSLQFQQDDSLRAQRMTADEAKAVIDLWQQERVEQTGLTDRPAVPDVAEGLDIGVEDVQRLLQAVRMRRGEEERALAQGILETCRAEEIKRHTYGKFMGLACLVLTIVIVFWFVGKLILNQASQNSVDMLNPPCLNGYHHEPGLPASYSHTCFPDSFHYVH